MKILRRPTWGPRTGTVNFFVNLLVSAALSFIASRLAAKKIQAPFQDAPTSLTTRSARIPPLIGRRQLAPIHAMAGKRETDSNSNYYEIGWHLLCVGPIRAIHTIYDQGTPVNPASLATVFPITPSTNPSGTRINIDKFGSFFPYYGEGTQPLDTTTNPFYEPLAITLGIESRWLEVCHLVFRSTDGDPTSRGKFLGPAAFWNQIKYEPECGIQVVGLMDSVPYWDNVTVTDLSQAVPNFETGATGAVFYVLLENIGWFKPGLDIEVTDASIPSVNGFFRVVIIDFTPAFLPDGVVAIIVIPFATFVGTFNISPRTNSAYSGANPAHVIYQWLFGGWPHGMALRKSKFDIESLEQIGVYFEQNPAPVNFAATDGITIEGALTRLMQDHGIARTWTRDGLIRFVLLRPVPEAEIVTFPKSMILGPLPEIESQQGPLPATRVLYEFADRDRNFTTNVVPIVDDAADFELGFTRDRKVQLHTVTDYPTAEAIANRRAQEDLGRARAGEVFLGRQARDLSNGQVFRLEGYRGTWRVLGVGRDPLTSRTRVGVVRDPYDVAPALGIGDPGGSGGGSGGGTVALDDVAQAPIEMPPWWGQAPGITRALFLRARATSAVIPSQVHTSTGSQGIATPLGAPQTSLAAFTLDAELPANTLAIVGYPGHADGPEATLISSDAEATLDLSGDDPSWLGGIQIAAIGSGAQVELCFLRRAVFVSGAAYTLEGLIRGQFGTQKRTWPAGTVVFVGARSSLGTLDSSTFSPGSTRFFKAPAKTATQEVSLAETPETSLAFAGANVYPMAPGNLRGFPAGLGINTPAFRNGDSLEFDWSQVRNDLLTGFGQQPFGDAHTAAPMVGTMTHRLYADNGGVPAAAPSLVVNQGASTGAIYTYAQLFTSPGAPFESLTTHEERAIWFSVQHTIAGNNSPEVFFKMEPV